MSYEMEMGPEERPSWEVIVGRRLFDRDRRPVGRIIGLHQESENADTFARVVPHEPDSAEMLIPVSLIGILSQDWAMLDWTLDEITMDEMVW